MNSSGNINIDAGEYSDNDEDPIKIHSSAFTGMLSAQSQVLGNLDLLQSIFSFFHSSLGTVSRIPVPDSQHLLWASLTCKAFFEPAMSVLWRALDSWMPLLRLIPALNRDHELYTMDGIIHEEDLQRLRLYGRWTRRLDLRIWRHSVSPYIYTCLSQLSHSQFFPSLRQLIIPQLEDLANEDYPGLFFTPSSMLSELSIGSIGPRAENVVVSLLQNVYMKTPTLRELALRGQFNGPTNSFSFLNRFNNLETLRIDIMETGSTGDILECFSKLPCLKSLRIGLDGWYSFLPSSSRHSFETLHNLDISASTTQILAILQHMVLQSLKGIRVHITTLLEYSASQASIGECVQQISMATPATQLKTVHITSGNAREVIHIPASELKWLLQAQITHIDISVDLISYKLIRRLSSGGGQRTIEKLVLRSGKVGKVPGQETSITFFGWLRSMVLFPNLKHLAIAVTLRMDAYKLNEMRGRLQTPAACHRLQELVFLPFDDSHKMLIVAGSATVENAFVLSRYIIHFFPHLKILDFSRITEIDAGWRKGVEVMAKGLQEMGESGHICQDEK